jgi:hypothetical protein
MDIVAIPKQTDKFVEFIRRIKACASISAGG